MTTIQQMEAQVGRRVRYLGSSDPDPDLETGQEGEVLGFNKERFLLLVLWDVGEKVHLLPDYDSWEVITEGEASDDTDQPGEGPA
jgi:hypothetical protein